MRMPVEDSNNSSPLPKHRTPAVVRAGIVGTTGYAAREVLRILATHPSVQVTAVVSQSAAGQPLEAVLPAFRKVYALDCEAFDPAALATRCDVVFLAVPSAKSMEFGAALRKEGVRVIDVGADFRLKDPAVFEAYYKTPHTAPDLLAEAVYGLPVIHREELRGANLVAVPGCYPISIVTPLWPLRNTALAAIPVVADSISGISGAGSALNEAFHFPEMNENAKAYGVATHRHTPEMEQALEFQITLQFTPHVGPYTRGILSTLTVRPEADIDLDALYASYAAEPFVRVLGEGNLPELKHVRNANFCDFGWVHDARTGNLVIVSAIDNMVGGTAGMAVQCLNLMFGLEESTGILFPGMAP